MIEVPLNPSSIRSGSNASANSAGSGSTYAPQRSNRSSRYGTSCIACRRRKQKCDSMLPSCSRCQRVGAECVYEGNTRVQSGGQLGAAYNSTLQLLRDIVSPHSTIKDFEIRSRIAEHLNNYPQLRQVRGMSTTPASPPSGRDATVFFEDEPDGRIEIDELLMHMSLVDGNHDGHYGMTGMHWRPPSDDIVERLHRRLTNEQMPSITPGMKLNEEIKSSWREGERTSWEVWATEEDRPHAAADADILKVGAALLPAWEGLAFSKLELEKDAETADRIKNLLKVYFTWQYPVHCVVYRLVFIRDMALGGPYFNEFLLNAICATAGMLGEGKTSGKEIGGQDFFERAQLLLSEQMNKPSAIPTIQGLILLAQRQCALGNLSQGWLYTGMGHTMSRDIGLHLDCSRLPIFGFGTLSEEDREIRRRLFWSVYTWDKTVSLALGRSPTFNAWQNVSPGPILDDTEDNDIWVPYSSDEKLMAELGSYLPQKSLSTLNFRHNAKLSEIMCKIIIRLYDGRPERMRNMAFVNRMKLKLHSWFADLPPELKLDVNNLPEHCPPPHIFAVNALYRAAWILLYRIFLPNVLSKRPYLRTDIGGEAARTCTAMATEIHHLFGLYSKTFKLHYMTFSLDWAMYSAAIINAIDFQSSDPAVRNAASPRLGMSLHVLEKSSKTHPGVLKSIEIIKQKLLSPTKRVNKRGSDSMLETPPAPLPRRETASQHSEESQKDVVPGTFNSTSSGMNITTSPPDVDLVSLLVTDEGLTSGSERVDPFPVSSTWMIEGQQAPGDPVMDILAGMTAMPSTTVSLDYFPFSDWLHGSPNR